MELSAPILTSLRRIPQLAIVIKVSDRDVGSAGINEPILVRTVGQGLSTSCGRAQVEGAPTSPECQALLGSDLATAT